MLTDLRLRMNALFRREKLEREMNAELGEHFHRQREKLRTAGLPPQAASRQARLIVGGPEQLKEEIRDARGTRFFETLAQDLRYAARMLRKNPGFTAVAVLTLALGIGASTAVFSLVNAVLFKPLPYPDAGRIVFPWLQAPAGLDLGAPEIPWHRVAFNDVRRDSKSFQHLGAFLSATFNLTGSGDPVRIDGLRASAGFFPSLGTPPELGRFFTAEEDLPGHELEVILSDQLWREKFAADPAIIGRSISLDARPYTVVGVMPAGFDFPRAEEMPSATFNFPRRARLWVPLALDPGPLKRGEPSELAVLGRLAPGVSVSQAQAELDIFTKRFEERTPAAKGWYTFRVKPLAAQIVGDTRRPLLLVLGAVGVVLLITCANIANLLLTRAVGRRREFTLRAALGAGKSRVVRQLLTESFLLALLGAALGVALTFGFVAAIKAFGPPDIPRLQQVSVDLRVLAFVAATALFTGLVFGFAPALGIRRENYAESLRDLDHRSGGNVAAARLRKMLIVAEVALALVLVVAAGLLVQTFTRLLRSDGGFNPSRVLTFERSLPDLRYPDNDRIVALDQRVLEALRQLPGVESAGIGETVPMSGAGESTAVTLPDRGPTEPKLRPFANYTFVSPGYFSAVGTPILAGRDFADTDSASSGLVAIVNLSFAKKYLGGQNPTGKHTGVPIVKEPMTIVGMVADSRHTSLREAASPEMYVPFTQKPWSSMTTPHIALRTKSDPVAMAESVRRAIYSIDPELPLANVATLQTMVNESMAQPRFAMLSLGAFGALALLLASIGMFGVISYSVSQRTREIGVRMALGARRATVLSMVLAQGLRLAAVGIAIGVAAALGVTRLMERFLYGVRPSDPLTYVAVSALLALVVAISTLIPARRAAAIDPMLALRQD
jgi:predicted permease